MAGDSGGRTVKKWAGKWALVTGASAGIGEEVARQLAAAGTHLVLTARRADRLQSLASDLSSKYQTKVEVISADLTQTAAPEQVYAFTKGRGIEIELLVNNAGFGAFGYVHKV